MSDETTLELCEALRAAKGIQVRVACMCHGRDFENAERELTAIYAQIDAALAKAEAAGQ